jgi:hypothetical protein
VCRWRSLIERTALPGFRWVGPTSSLFSSARSNPSYGPVSQNYSWRSCCYSDNTQLRLATTRAIHNHGFDIETFARVALWVSWLHDLDFRIFEISRAQGKNGLR